MKKLFSLFISIVLFTHLSFGQDSSNVSITASGRGASQAEAQQYALRSAIEQAYGAFISSKTEILNDEIVADQMASVASGNIQSFEILNETELPDRTWASTIKAVVSVEKLTSFVQSKGIEVEIKGGLFAANIKQQMLNEQGEVEAIYNMVGVLHEVMQTAFDFKIIAKEPQAIGSENQNWKIPLQILVTPNKNFEFSSEYFQKIINSIKMSNSERSEYHKVGKPVYSFDLKCYSNNSTLSPIVSTICLRKETSIDILSAFYNLYPYYISNFTINTNLGQVNIDKKANYEAWYSDFRVHDKLIKYQYSENRNANPHIKLIDIAHTIEQPITIFNFNDKKSLSQINELSNYTISSNNVMSEFSQGGILVTRNNGEKIVVGIVNLWVCPYEDPKCEKKRSQLKIDGFNDWRGPIYEESLELSDLIIHTYWRHSGMHTYAIRNYTD